MSKKRVSIYIEEGIWEHVKEEAWRLRMSASGLFEKMVMGEIPFSNQATVTEVAEIIEDTKAETISKISKAESDLLKSAQKRAIKRKEKVGKIAELKSTGFFNPQPKG